MFFSWKIDQIKLFRIGVLVLETKREKYFQILSYFPVRCSGIAGKQQFQ